MGRRRLLVPLGLALGLGTGSGAAADVGPEAAPVVDAGSYERFALELALESRNLELDPAPAGKRIGRVLVVNLDVFGSGEGFLTFFNFLHVTTRDHVIAREVLLEPGDLWDPDRVQESRRRLRDPLFTSLAVLAPVKSAEPGMVDLLVVTRDIWSLRMNSSFEVQEGQLTALSISLSENNLFGYRKQVATVFDLDQGSYSLGPQYVDKNIAGTRLQLATKLGAIFGRESGEFEGTRSYTSFGYPLWSLDTEWGAGVELSHYDSTIRLFRGADLRTYDDPDTEVVEELPWTYDYRVVDLESSVVRSMGDHTKHRVRVGHELRVRRPSLLDDFPGDPAAQEAFARDVFPRSERSSGLFARYTLFTPTFRIYRDLDSYDLAEDVKLGPDLQAEVGVALGLLGSERNFARGSLGAAWTFDVAGDGFVRASAGASTRLQSGELIDNLATATLTAALPRLGGLVRPVGRLSAGIRLRERNNRFFIVGGESGLRGYQIGAFTGQVRAIANLELRSAPVPVLFTRLGGVLFYDVGHAAEELSELSLHHDVGVGARLLIPQLQSVVFRFDWAVPFQGPSAGFPGRFSAGVLQVF